jgi:hypothetical protein
LDLPCYLSALICVYQERFDFGTAFDFAGT